MEKLSQLKEVNFELVGPESYKLREFLDKNAEVREYIYQLAAVEKVAQAIGIISKVNSEKEFYSKSCMRGATIRFANGILINFRTNSDDRVRISANYTQFDQDDDVYFEGDDWVEFSTVRAICKQTSDKIPRS